MSIRAFFAIDLEDKNLIQAVRSIQKELTIPETTIKFVTPENLHLTLKFLGNIKEDLVAKLQQAAEAITFEPFTLEFKGVGCLPSLSYINAIYIAITTGFEPLAALAAQIETMCSRFQLKKENRPFKAHLTIGRLKRTTNKALLVSKIQALNDQAVGALTIEHFTLKKSVLTPQGPVYSTLFQRAAEPRAVE